MSGKQMVKYYQEHGWIKIRQTGSHVIMSKEGKGRMAIPIHGNKTLGKGLESKLLKGV